jgi:hypothetical protein
MENEIIFIRGHHVHNLKDYLDANKNNDLFLYEPLSEYGEEYCKNQLKILKEIISNENCFVKIIAGYDSFCEKCHFKVEGGCLKNKTFYEKESIKMADIERLKDFPIKLNKIYTGKEILKLIMN